MSNKGQTLQDPFLNVLRKEHIPVSIYWSMALSFKVMWNRSIST